MDAACLYVTPEEEEENLFYAELAAHLEAEREAEREAASTKRKPRRRDR